MQRLVDVEMPLIAAANGPASVHSEGVLLADIAIAEHSTVFSDYSHPAFGTVPGDGVALIWQEVLGINRARAPNNRHTADGGHGLAMSCEERSPNSL